MNDSSATTIFIVLNYFVIVGIALIAKYCCPVKKEMA